MHPPTRPNCASRRKAEGSCPSQEHPYPCPTLLFILLLDFDQWLASRKIQGEGAELQVL